MRILCGGVFVQKKAHSEEWALLKNRLLSKKLECENSYNMEFIDGQIYNLTGGDIQSHQYHQYHRNVI